MTNGGMETESCSTQVQQLREAFSVFDKSGDGKVRTNRRVMPDVLDSCRFNMPAKHALPREASLGSIPKPALPQVPFLYAATVAHWCAEATDSIFSSE